MGVYEDAERASFASAGHPGMDISGNARGCLEIAGRFEIHQLEWAGSDLANFTVTFEQFCDDATEPLTGCVHFEL